jgi:hypothetical protein
MKFFGGNFSGGFLLETLGIFRDCERNADGAVSPFWVSKKGTLKSIFTA